MEPTRNREPGTGLGDGPGGRGAGGDGGPGGGLRRRGPGGSRPPPGPGAADAAALAGAAKLLLGPGEACSAAAELVVENQAEMESCEVGELEVTVRVTTEPAGIGDLFGPARASSRAGPVTAL
ncbi:hypothetical protein GCM10029992_15680 [Glycomyces albus]